MTSGFEAFQRGGLENFVFDSFLSKGHIYQTEMRYYCRDQNYLEVPITYIAGDSSLKIKSIYEAISVLFRLKKNDKKVRKTSILDSKGV